MGGGFLSVRVRRMRRGYEASGGLWSTLVQSHPVRCQIFAQVVFFYLWKFNVASIFVFALTLYVNILHEKKVTSGLNASLE